MSGRRFATAANPLCTKALVILKCNWFSVGSAISIHFLLVHNNKRAHFKCRLQKPRDFGLRIFVAVFFCCFVIKKIRMKKRCFVSLFLLFVCSKLSITMWIYLFCFFLPRSTTAPELVSIDLHWLLLPLLLSPLSLCNGRSAIENYHRRLDIQFDKRNSFAGWLKTCMSVRAKLFNWFGHQKHLPHCRIA